jgi:hypothetical protein
VKVGSPNKWGKRIAERIDRACAEPGTLWFPADKRACPGAASAPAATAPPPAPTAPPPAKK